MLLFLQSFLLRGISGNFETQGNIYVATYSTCRIQNLDIPRAGRRGAAHSSKAGGAGAARQGAAGRCGMAAGGRAQDCGGTMRPGENRPSCPPGHRRQLSWMILRRHELRKSYVNRIEEHSGRLTSGLSAGRKTLFFPDSRLLTNGPMLFCLCKPFSCKACPGKSKTCRFQNLNIPPGEGGTAVGRDPAGPGWAAPGWAGRGEARWGCASRARPHDSTPKQRGQPSWTTLRKLACVKSNSAGPRPLFVPSC